MEDKELQAIIEAAVDKAVTAAGLKEIQRKFVPGAEGKAETGERFETLGEQLRAVFKAAVRRDVDPRLVEQKATGLSEGIPSEGGFLVQQEFVDKLLEKVWQTGIVAAKCYSQSVGAGFNGITIPAVDETSRVAGSRWGGVRAYWASEAGTKTASKPTFRQVALKLEKLVGLCVMTDELLEDVTGMEDYVNRWFPLEFGFQIDDAVINGDGAGKPLGVLNAPCTVSIAKETGQAAATILAENVDKMWARFWAPSRANSVWLINQDIEPQLAKMSYAVGTGGLPVYIGVNGLSATPYATLKGRPVIPIEQCATLGTVGDIILADFSQYILIQKGGVKGASSIHVYFSTDETAFRWVWRINGQPIWNAALTPFKGTNSQSPFITLATRA